MTYREGSKSWSGARRCDDGDRLYPECEGTDDHLHCDGPLRGAHVRFKTSQYQKALNDPLFSDTRPVRRGVGEVVLHWHYEGCMIDVTCDGVRLTIVPELGDEAEVVARPCIAARERMKA